MNQQTITPASLEELRKKGEHIDLIDVRTPAEFREVHVEYARNIPLDRLDPKAVVKSRNGEGHQPVYLICRSGKRGKQACDQFTAAGFSNAINVAGGTQACESAGLPIIRGKKVMSLERQVRIAAGSFTVIGAVLALTVHPFFAGICAFIGAGLVFAGVTDTCGMAMLLAKMPWNR